MAPGWHTYWRYPGDSGVPPRFDFSGSDNLASAQVLLSGAAAVIDEAGNTHRLQRRRHLPGRGARRKTPAQAGDACASRSTTRCARSCACRRRPPPSLTLTRGNSAARCRARRRRGARAATGRRRASWRSTVKRVNDAAKPLVAVDLKSPSGKPVEVFAEGPTPEWALPIPKPAPGAPDGPPAFQLRARRPAAGHRRQRPGRPDLHRGRRRARLSRSRPVSTNPRATA